MSRGPLALQEGIRRIETPVAPVAPRPVADPPGRKRSEDRPSPRRRPRTAPQADPASEPDTVPRRRIDRYARGQRR